MGTFLQLFILISDIHWEVSDVYSVIRISRKIDYFLGFSSILKTIETVFIRTLT